MVKFEGWSGILIEGLLKKISELNGMPVKEVKRDFGDAVTDAFVVAAIIEFFETQRKSEAVEGMLWN